MKKFASFVVLAIVAGLFASQAEARPDYLKGATKAHPDNKKVAELKCAVCHGELGKNKKKVSDYGKALSEALGAKNVKDETKIAEAIKKAGEKKEGEKTYDEIFKAGELPKAAE